MIGGVAEEVGAAGGQTRGFLFADLRGYTDFVERRGDDAAAGLLERYRTLVRGVVARHTGAEVKTEGDSCYVLFPSASSAVAAGLDIVASAAAESAEHPDAPIRVGVGVHAGETSVLPEGPVGSAVNMAARICAQAGAGEVLVSDTVRGLTRTRNVAVFANVGSRRLKGIAEPVALYRAAPPGTIIKGGSRRPTSKALPASWVGIGLAILVLVPATWIIATVLGSAGASPTPAASNASPTAPSAATPTNATSPTAVPVTGTRIIYSRQIGADGCGGVPLDAKLHVLDPDHPAVATYRVSDRSNLLEIEAAWSADGSTIGLVGSVGRGPSGLFTIDASGAPLNVLVAPLSPQALNPFSPPNVTVAPDGSAVVHMDEDALWRTPTDGSGRTQVAGVIRPEDPELEPPPAVERYRDVVYRSDGTLLVLIIGVDGGTPWLETMGDDGSNRTRVELDLEGLDVGGISLAADDDTLALLVPSELGSSIQVGRISSGISDFEVVDFDAENPSQPALSPTGSELVVSGDSNGTEQLYVADLASGEVTQLTDDPDASACSPAWREAPPDLLAGRPALQPGAGGPFELGQLPSGPVLNEVVDPPIQLTFPDGWFARRNYVDGFSVFRPGEVYGEIDYGRLQFNSSGSCDDTELVAVGPLPNDLLSNLQARSDLELAAVGPINLGGYSGITADISGKPEQGCGEPEFRYWSLFRTAQDGFSLSEDEHLRLVALDVRGSTRSFLIFALAPDIDSYWTEKARPILETVVFPEG